MAGLFVDRHKARTWVADWRDYDALVDMVRHQVAQDLKVGSKTTVSAADFSDIDPCSLASMSGGIQRAFTPAHVFSPTARAFRRNDRRLRIGTEAVTWMRLEFE